MNRVVVRLNALANPDGASSLVFSLAEPPVFNSPVMRLICDPNDPLFTGLTAPQPARGAIRDAGRRLYDELAAHPAVQQQFQIALATQYGDRLPIFIEIATPAGAEALPWEALCASSDDFLGLDPRWALARMVQPTRSRSAPYTFRPPLRIAAILSCLGVSAAGELAELRDMARLAGPDRVQLLVIGSEDQLLSQLRDEMTAGTAPEIADVRLIPDDLVDLQSHLVGFAPHVLHLFCHGSAQGGAVHVALARKSDWFAADPTDGLIIEARDFHRLTRGTDDLPWLVVLNCCESAAVGAAADTQSLALSLALDGVAPAVVGMREPIQGSTANLVTRALYRALVTEINAHIAAAAGSPRPVDWPSIVVAARDQLSRTYANLPPSQAAASTKEWTLPVIYVSPDDFNLQIVAAPLDGSADPAEQADATLARRAAQLEIEALNEISSALQPDDALVTEVAARVDRLTTYLSSQLPKPDRSTAG